MTKFLPALGMLVSPCQMEDGEQCLNLKGAVLWKEQEKQEFLDTFSKHFFFYQMSPNLLMLPEMLWISLHWQLSRSDMALSIFGFKLSLLLFGGLRQKIIKVAL